MSDEFCLNHSYLKVTLTIFWKRSDQFTKLLLQPFQQNNLEITLISRCHFLFQYHATSTLFLRIFFKQVNNSSHFPTICPSKSRHMSGFLNDTMFFGLSYKFNQSSISILSVSVRSLECCKRRCLFLQMTWGTGFPIQFSIEENFSNLTKTAINCAPISQ